MQDKTKEEIINLVSDTPEEAQRIREWSDANAGRFRMMMWCIRCSGEGDDFVWLNDDRTCPSCGTKWGK